MKQENPDMANWANEHKKWLNSGQEQKSYCKKEGLLVSDPRTPYSRWPPIDRKISLKR